MSANKNNSNTVALSEDFEAEQKRAYDFGVQDGMATRDFRSAAQFAQSFHDDVPADYLPPLPEDAKDGLDELIKTGELSNDDEVIEQYCLGYAEGCSKAIEAMHEHRSRQIEKPVTAAE
jgi:hypothetical protein